MATQDEDTLTGSVPDPDIEPTPAELAHARRFAELVDKTLTGRTPPAMSADDRALLEVATVIRATRGQLELAPARRHAVVEDALRQAIGTGPSPGGSVTPLARVPARRWAPWIVAGASTLVAAAALLVLWLRPAEPPRSASFGHPPGRPPAPVEWTSRPTDALIGRIERNLPADASARIDTIFADRLDGFRARRLAPRGTRGTP
jgi:hypothetical protein